MKAQSLLLAVLFSAGLAHADLPNTEAKSSANVVNQNLAKRPYVAPVEKTDVIEGNVVDTDKKVESEKRYKLLNLHQLGRRPHVEKSSD